VARLSYGKRSAMIVVDKITKYYGERAAVRDMSFTINAGEVVGLLGLNGAGKTTTLKMLSGVMLPTSGRVTVDGVDLMQSPDSMRSRIGFLPESPPLYPEMKVRDFVTFAARIKGVSEGLAAKVDEALRATNLTDVQHQQISTLSNGFQRRVGIAQAIVHSPALIVLDEPTSGLDPVQVAQMRDLINGLKAKHTVLVSSHILSEIQALCDRIIVIHQGQIAAIGTEAELASRDAAMTVEIEVRGSASELAQLLANNPDVINTSSGATSTGITQATVELRRDAREELARAIVQAGLGLRQMESVRPELESIFFRLTKSKDAGAPS
jgi:ABC-2 type transport system ATP-binding protein